MQSRFRTDYPGEFVILESKWTAGKKIQTREWVANPIENHHISGRAVCIASDFDSAFIDHTILERHRGGLLGSKKLQTYGTGTIAKDMRLDFTVETDLENLTWLIEQQYTESNIVYTTTRNCINNPGQFYLIPHNPKLIDTATLPYLASFDGHTEIFLIGYNKELPTITMAWQEDLTKVFNTYTGVKFFLVGKKHLMFDSWLSCSNVDVLNYREFVGYCDV